ncbi:MAG: hypothetical protein ABIQ77_10895 [Anaerolineales bacterium]
MFFQEPTPDTSGYMIAGYVIAFVVMGLYVASLYLRYRNLNRDMAMLEEMDTPVVQLELKQPKTKPSKLAAKSVTKRGRKKPP